MDKGTQTDNVSYDVEKIEELLDSYVYSITRTTPILKELYEIWKLKRVSCYERHFLKSHPLKLDSDQVYL